MQNHMTSRMLQNWLGKNDISKNNNIKLIELLKIKR